MMFFIFIHELGHVLSYFIIYNNPNPSIFINMSGIPTFLQGITNPGITEYNLFGIDVTYGESGKHWAGWASWAASRNAWPNQRSPA